MNLTEKIDKLVTLIEHPRTRQTEREAAQRMLARLKAKAAEQSGDTTATSTARGMYERAYGRKYTGYLSSTEIAKRIREDIKLARKVGKMAAKPGALKIADPIADAPDEIRFSVRKEDYAGGRSIDVTIKNVPADWWIDRVADWDPSHSWKVAGPRLKDLKAALKEITWAYNYDGSDLQSDYFDRNFYEHFRADGHGEGVYPRSI